mgnify:CR=1 FL=1
MMKFIGLLVVWSAWSVGLVGMAKDTTGPGNGHLVIVGGGLRPNNRAVFEKIVEYAGGAERAKAAPHLAAFLQHGCGVGADVGDAPKSADKK